MSNLLSAARVTTEVACRRKFSQFMAYHVFGHKNWHEGFTIVHCDGFPHHGRDDHRRAAPGLDDLFTVALLCFFDLLQQRVMDVRTFFE